MADVSTLRIEVIDEIKERVFHLVQGFVAARNDCGYADIRLSVEESRYAAAEEGKPKECGEDAEIAYGVRVLARNGAAGGMVAPGYFGLTLGSDLAQLDHLLEHGLERAYGRAKANAKHKDEAERLLGALSNSLQSTVLAPVEVCQESIVYPFAEDPRGVSIERLLNEATEASKLAAGLDRRVLSCYALVGSGLVRELFASSEGALIDQTYPLTRGFYHVVAEGGGAPESHYDTLGDLKGYEVIGGDNVEKRNFQQFAQALTEETLELAQAPPLPADIGEVVVLTDPHYNALLVHEIVGHPVEADRALKLETGYAGRTWLFGGPDENMIGERIASELVSAYSDPAMQGFGHYKYDAEGVKGRRVMHIDRGVFMGFMNGRESASLLGAEPNGSMRATDPVFVPLVRMTNTVFAEGASDPKQMLRDVEHGYFLQGNRIPSISESRENFRITARKVYKIEGGEVTTLYRNGGISADSKDFLMSIDAVGNDFRMYPIPNCGKGQPMQTMRVGNGGPTMRGRAKVVGGEQ